MKLADRLALLKAGYTKDDISKLAEEDQKAEAAEQAAEPVDAPAEYMDVIKTLAAEVKSLKDAVHAQNIDNAEVKPKPAPDAVDILSELFAPNSKGD